MPMANAFTYLLTHSLTYLLACLLTYLLTYVHTYSLTCLLTYLLTYVRSYLPTYLQVTVPMANAGADSRHLVRAEVPLSSLVGHTSTCAHVHA